MKKKIIYYFIEFNWKMIQIKNKDRRSSGFSKEMLKEITRTDTEEKKVLNISDLTINIEAYTVYVGSEKIPMSKKEVETMWILAGNPSKVFTRDNLLDSLWGQDYFGDSRTVDSHIKRLRAKLDKVEHPDWEIKTIWGLGYKFELNV